MGVGSHEALHKANHTNGVDDIQSAGAAQKGLIDTTAQTIAGKKTFSGGVVSSQPIELGTSPTVGSFVEGKIYYDNTNKTPAAEIGTATTLKMGQQLYTRVYNDTGTLIPKGSVCKIQSSTAGRIETSLAVADGYLNTPWTSTGGTVTFTLAKHGYTNDTLCRVKLSSDLTALPNGCYPITNATTNTFDIVIGSGDSSGTAHIILPNQVAGLAAQDISSGAYGFLINRGIHTGLIANTLSVGDIVYCSDVTPGAYTNDILELVLESRSNQVGYVIQTGTTTGQIYVDISNEESNTSITNIERNILEGNIVSTGAYDFSGIIVNSGDPTHKVDVPIAKGWVVKNTGSNATRPSIINVVSSALTAVTLTYLATHDSTYFMIDSSGNVYQQPTRPTPQERRENILLGKVVHPNRTTILTINNTTDYDTSPMSALRDMFMPIQLINEGVSAYANGANLNFNTSAGNLYGMGINWSNNPLNPNQATISASTPKSFFYRTQLGGTTGSVSLIDPTKYDVGGTITDIPAGGDGSGERSTNQRIYMYSTGVINVQYGQQYYASLAEAVAEQRNELFVKAPNVIGAAILIGIISVRRAATDLSISTEAVFTSASIFGEVSGSVSGIATTTLQQAYDNSITPEILTDSTRGAVTLKRGSTADTDNVIEIQNNAGTITHGVTGNGNIIVPKTTGIGIKVDTTTPTFGWKDLIGPIVVDTLGADAGTLDVYRGGLIREYRFGVGDKCDFRFHMPHDWVPGTDLYIHVHWSHNGTAITGTGTFSCGLTHSYAKGYNQAAFTAEETITCADTNVTTATTPQYRHKITEVQLSGSGGTGTLLDTSILEIDGLILINLTVGTIPTITGGTTAEPFIHFTDIHYQSTQMATKDKNYPFYT